MRLSVEDLRQKKTMKQMADDIEAYAEQVEDYAIIDGLNLREYKKAMALVKELIENLRKGKADKVYSNKLEQIVEDLNGHEDDEYPF